MEVKGRVIFSSFRASIFMKVRSCRQLVGPYHGQSQVLGPNLLPATLSPTSPENLLTHAPNPSAPSHRLQALGKLGWSPVFQGGLKFLKSLDTNPPESGKG